MAAVLLDTTVLIDLLRGRSGAAERLRALRSAGDQPCTCAINVEELERGARSGDAEAIARLLDGLTIAPLSRPEGTLAGRWRREHAARGVVRDEIDTLGGRIDPGQGFGGTVGMTVAQQLGTECDIVHLVLCRRHGNGDPKSKQQTGDAQTDAKRDRGWVHDRSNRTFCVAQTRTLSPL